MKEELNTPFTEICIYQVKPQKVEEFEALMFEAKAFGEARRDCFCFGFAKEGIT